MKDLLNLDWFNTLRLREQWLVLIAAALTLCMIVFSAFWSPMKKEHTRLEKLNTNAAETEVWMQQTVGTIKKLKGSGSTASTNASLSQVADKEAKSYGLRIARFNPMGDNEAQVMLERVPFDKALGWFNAIENRHGVQVVTATLSASGDAGLVSVRARLKSGG